MFSGFLDRMYKELTPLIPAGMKVRLRFKCLSDILTRRSSRLQHLLNAGSQPGLEGPS